MQKIFTRDFNLILFSQFTFTLVFCMLIPTIPIYLLQSGAREGEIGFLVGIFSVSSLVVRPIVGRSLNKNPERSLMIAGTLIYVISSLAYLFAPRFWPLFIVRAFHGIGLAFFSTSIFTLLANVTTEANRGRITSYFFVSPNLAYALGPYFAMLIINRLDFNTLFLVCAGLSLGSFYIVTKLKKRQIIQVEHQPLKIQSLLSRKALPPAIIFFGLNVLWGSIIAFFPLYAVKHGVSNPGTFFIFLAATPVLGRVFGGRLLDIYNREKVIMPCLMLIIIAIAILAFSKTMVMFIIVAVMYGLGVALITPYLMIYSVEIAGIEKGPAMATFTALGDLGAGLGPMIMGFILELMGYPIMFSCLIITGVINLFYYYHAIVKRARMPGNS